MMDDLLSFVAPVLAEVKAAGLEGWSVSTAEVSHAVSLRRGDRRIDFDADADPSLRWCIWVGPNSPVQGGPDLAAAIAAARADGWTP